MRLEEGCNILGVELEADLDAVKSAYRKMAFALHPDLNPKDPNAKRNFQRLNEAYLLLKHYHENKSQKRAKAQAGAKTQPPPKEEATTSDRARAEAAYKKQQQKRASYSKASSASGPSAGFYFKREEVLQDLLKDPFARQVFQDIYQQVKHAHPDGAIKASRKKELRFQWGDSGLSLDLSKGVTGGIKEYFRKQLDDEQTVRLPVANLLPGTKIRVGIKHGFGNAKATTIEVTLPGDFVVGRPIRLKGMGRRIGPWRGDLYLRILARTV